MNCEEATNLMDGYLDGELDPITSQTIEQHLRECPKCDQAYKIHGSLIRVIGNATPYYKAPAELRERIQSSLQDAVGAKDKGGSGQPDDSQSYGRKESGVPSFLRRHGTGWLWQQL